jgi:hypothetical protein
MLTLLSQRYKLTVGSKLICVVIKIALKFMQSVLLKTLLFGSIGKKWENKNKNYLSRYNARASSSQSMKLRMKRLAHLSPTFAMKFGWFGTLEAFQDHLKYTAQSWTWPRTATLCNSSQVVQMFAPFSSSVVLHFAKTHGGRSLSFCAVNIIFAVKK